VLFVFSNYAARVITTVAVIELWFNSSDVLLHEADNFKLWKEIKQMKEIDQWCEMH